MYEMQGIILSKQTKIGLLPNATLYRKSAYLEQRVSRLINARFFLLNGPAAIRLQHQRRAFLGLFSF
jgi:hypothetical protein